MPPKDIKNGNIPLDTFKITPVDPVFKSTQNQQIKTKQTIKANPYNVLTNQKFTTGQTTTPITKSAENAKLTAPKAIVRTYKSDLESAIQTEHMSSINIAIAQNEKMRNQITTSEAGQNELPQTTNNSKSKIIILLSLIFILAGGVGIYAMYMSGLSNSNQIVIQSQEIPALITSENNFELNIDSIAKTKLNTILASNLIDPQIKVNTLNNIYLTTGSKQNKKLLTSTEFINQLNLHIPDSIKRNLQPDFMVGTFSFDQNLPFVILKTTSYENTYAGMLSWEKDLEKDFQVLFRLPGYENSISILNQLTPTTQNKFEDNVIVNKDIRQLKDNGGNVILLYGIVDRETVIITTSDKAFKEIVNRLNKEKTLKR